MLLRRLYSSAPPTRAGFCPSGPSTTKPLSRGRVKSARPSKPLRAASPTSSLTASPIIGKGRRRRPISLSKPPLTAPVSFSHPTANDYTFRPAHIYPAQMTLHRAFLPRHMPIPVHLGSSIYIKPHSIELGDHSTLGPFALPAAPSPASLLARPSATSALGDHLQVTSSLSHPSLQHYLGDVSPFRTPSSAVEGNADGALFDDEAFLPRTLAEAGVRNRLAGEWAWQETLAHLSGSSSTRLPGGAASIAEVSQQAAQGREEVEAAVADLAGLLERLDTPARGRKRLSVATRSGMGMGEEVVRMDSVKRKRKKKISKHKYKKRRKATRAQRKRLGK